MGGREPGREVGWLVWGIEKNGISLALSELPTQVQDVSFRFNWNF